MKLYFLIVAVALLAMSQPAIGKNDQPQTVTIPLGQVWAYKMPGTRDIQELVKAKADIADRRLFASISESAAIRAADLHWKNITRPGFAVAGRGLSALRGAHAVLVEDEKPSSVYSIDDEVTIVFFSEPVAGERGHIRNIERHGNLIEIQYRLEPYSEAHLSSSFALIPLGTLPRGEYVVEMRQLPRDDEFLKRGAKPFNKAWSSRFLCRPFSFRVTEKVDRRRSPAQGGQRE